MQMTDEFQVSPLFLTHFMGNAELYKPLVPAETIVFFGKNRRSICIIIQNNDKEATDAAINVLEKMIGHLQMSLEDVALVKYDAKTTPFDAICKQLKPRRVLIFGQDMRIVASLPFETTVLLNDLPVLQTYAIAQITTLADQEKKRTWAKIKDLLVG
jgi:hypothetical protein